MDNLNIKITEIGKFNMAYTFGNYFEFFGNALGMAIGPLYTGILSKATTKAEKDYCFVTHWMQWFFLTTGFILSLWCKELMDLLISNDELRKVYPLAIIIIMGYAYRPYYWAVVTKMQFDEQTSQLWKISFIAGVVNVLLNIILVPIYGIMAAAITTFIALMYMGFSGYYLKTMRTSLKKSYYPASIMAVIIFSTISVYLLKDISGYYKAYITLAVFLAYTMYSWNKRKIFSNIEL